MEKHPIENIMAATLENIRDMVDVNTVIGEPIPTSEGSTIIPLSRVSFGFVAGGGEYAVEDGKQKPVPTDVFPFAGGTGAGVSVQPVGFLVVTDKQVKMLPAQTTGAMERMVELLPQLIEELNAKDEKKKNKIFGKTDDELLDGELQ